MSIEKIHKYTQALVILIVLFITIVVILTSCKGTHDTMTGCSPRNERNSLRKINKALARCPAAFAGTCASLYPTKDSTHETISYTRDTMVISDTVTNYDSVTHTYTRTITNTKTITITVNNWFYIQKTNTAALEAENQKTNKAIIDKANALAIQKGWLSFFMWFTFILIGIDVCVLLWLKFR